MIARALVLRPILREKIRTALTVAGIAVGVAVVVAIQLANQSALRAFRESVDAIAGRANYQIVSEAAGIEETTLLALQPLWNEGVRFAPVIDMEGMVEPSRMPIRLLAVDLLSDLHFRDYKYARIAAREEQPQDLRVFLELFREDSVVVPAPFAKQHGLAVGSPLRLNIRGRRATMIVRGILEAEGPATAFNGAIAVADISAAQRSFRLAGRVTRIDLMIPDARAEAVLAKIRRVLPGNARVERPSRRNERVAKMLRAFRINLFALAGVALLVGMFLVYNTVLISILRRRKDVGVLKTVGVAPRQIFGAFAIEGLLFGAAGSALGIALGVALATGILRMIGATINTLYVSSRPEGVVLTPGVILLGIAVGTVLSFVSALQPALEAARIRPSAMIRAGRQQRMRRSWPLAAGAIGCFAAAVVCSLLPPVRGIAVAGYVAVLLVVAGFSLLAPMIVRGASAAFARPLQALFGIVGKLAAASLPASLRRTSIASAALSLATGMMVAVALMVGSFRETVNVWIGQTISSDLWLRPSKGLTNADVAVFPPSIIGEVAKLPFVAGVDPVRGRSLVYQDELISIGSGEFGVAGETGNMPMVAPRSFRDAMRRARAVGGVFVSEAFSLKFGKSVGDVIELPVAGGRRRFEITGVYRDYSNDRGVVVMDRKAFIQSFRDENINTLVVYLKEGVDREQARRALENTFGPRYGAFAITNVEIRNEVMKIFDQTFLITYALLGVAIVVAVLGIVNTLAALILERTRELALLRVTGMSTAQVRTMIVLESSLLGVTSTVVGLIMGYALSWILIYVINKQSFGWTIEFHTPAALIAASLTVTTLSSAAAGLIPAQLARKIDFAAALKIE